MTFPRPSANFVVSKLFFCVVYFLPLESAAGLRKHLHEWERQLLARKFTYKNKRQQELQWVNLNFPAATLPFQFFRHVDLSAFWRRPQRHFRRATAQIIGAFHHKVHKLTSHTVLATDGGH
jgi:hypothetical protein